MVLLTDYQDLGESIGSAGSLFNLETAFPGGWRGRDLSELLRWAQTLEHNADAANAWLSYKETSDQLDAICDGDFCDHLRNVTDKADMVPQVVERLLCTSWLDLVYETTPLLREFSSTDHDDLKSQFKKLDQLSIKIATQRVAERAFQQYPQAGSSVVSWAHLLRFAEKPKKNEGSSQFVL